MSGTQDPPPPDILNNEDQEIVLPSTKKHAQQKSPFIISPPPVTIPEVGFFSGFGSDLAEDAGYGPFSVSSPFERTEKYDLRVTSLGQGSFSDTTVTASSNSYEHLSASVSVGVDIGILGGDVSVSYDKTVLDNHDSFKHSQHALYQDTVINYAEAPKMTKEAKGVLSGQDGAKRFQEKYGDYFIAGIIVGAEAGMMLSRSHDSHSEVEVTEVTVTVKVLFWSKSFSVTDTRVSSLDLRSYSFNSFCTLDKTCDTIASGATDATAVIVAKVKRIQGLIDGQDVLLRGVVVGRTPGFQELVDQQKRKLFRGEVDSTFWDRKGMSLASVSYESMRLSRLEESGVVWKIMLEPYWNLSEYQEVLVSA